MRYGFQKVAEICNAELQGRHSNHNISRVAIDSRSITSGEDTLFVALTGQRHDGHEYIEHAFEAGVKHFIAEANFFDAPEYTRIAKKASFIKVEDSLNALQSIAAYHRVQSDIPVIGVTGSNGKTIVKEWLEYILKVDYNVLKSPKSYNSQVGVALSLLNLRHDHQIAIIEAGISQPGEMKKLREMIRPDMGIFTNIGQAHQGNFASLEEKIYEKLQLFSESRQIFYCSDHLSVHEAVEYQKSNGFLPKNLESITWSRAVNDFLKVDNLEASGNGIKIAGIWREKRYDWEIPYHDKASLENSLHCINFSLWKGIKHEKLKERLATLPGMEMRLEFKKGLNNSTIINDSYNHDPESLSVALEVLKTHNNHPGSALILSDMVDTAMEEEELYKETGRIVQAHNPSVFIGIGPELMRFRHYFPDYGKYFESTEQFLLEMASGDFANKCVLLKGARKFAFEDIDRRLRQEHHRTRLEIDLDALIDNLNFFRRQLAEDTKLMVMVKAFSYGSGGAEIARLLEYNRVNYLGVAYSDEGLELRRSGIEMPIMVMNPDPASFDVMLEHNLEPEIYDFRLLKEFISIAEKHPSKFGIHLKVDTGMRRLGFEVEDAEQIIAMLKSHPEIEVKTVFSHLAASEDENEKEFTQNQINRFLEFCSSLNKGGIKGFLRHICNTNGIINYPQSHFEMVRLGLGMYGVDTGGKVADKLNNVLEYKTVVAQIKQIRAEDSVGYNRAGRLNKGGFIATLMAGYADGIKTSLGQGNGFVDIRGQKAPIVGKVCMDMMMVDVTGLDVKEGDEAVVFGTHPKIQDVAERADTIPYDILTGIPPRVKRVYFRH